MLGKKQDRLILSFKQFKIVTLGKYWEMFKLHSNLHKFICDWEMIFWHWEIIGNLIWKIMGLGKEIWELLFWEKRWEFLNKFRFFSNLWVWDIVS